MIKKYLIFQLIFSYFYYSGFGQTNSSSIKNRINSREFPSIFQAWYGIDMPEFPQNTLEKRLKAAAKHDLLWEEPLSQLGEKVDLVIGLVWDHKNHGLANSFTKESLAQAQENKKKLLELNPNMVFLFEIRWRDAPSSFLPENSEWWLRNEKGEIKKGWLGGWEPFYMLNYNNPDFQDNLARQAKIALESGIYDGVMLDWSGHVEIAKKIRKSIGKEGLIIVNLHDDIEDAKNFKDVINGSFMELNPKDGSTNIAEGGKEEKNLRSWNKIKESLLWFENNFQKPVVNCLEVWGDRKDLARMRATTTLGLTHSNGFTLYADPNPLKTPDHLHDWYPFWDIKLGKPIGKLVKLSNGVYRRRFEGGVAIYNHYQNGEQVITFNQTMKRASDGSIGKTFKIADRDGDIFFKP
jgi:hypothetical protein